MDGTLVDSYEAICESFNYALRCFRLVDAPPEVIREMVGEKLEKMFSPYLPEDKLVAAVEKYRENYRRVFLQKTLLLPGVAESLARLHQRGYRLGVATNKPAFFTNDILHNLAIDRYFRTVVGSEMVSQPKPHPEMLWRVMEELGGTRADTAYIGDSTLDIETGKAAGLPVFAVATGSLPKEKLAAAEPSYLAEHLPDLIGYLFQRAQNKE